MSKRFGRQQKRNLRKQIAELETSLALNKAAYRYASSTIDEMRDNFSILERVLGPYFVGIPPKQVYASEVQETYNIPIMVEPPKYRRWLGSDQRDLVYKVSRLKTTMVEADYNDMIGCVHIRLTGPAGTCSYAATTNALRMVPRDVFIERLSREIVMTLENSTNFNDACDAATPAER